ncbi:hypothetical protein AGMMS50267_12840 [Spirochaetia bacterium]|nr:hypothetical protein AGMMS50267_12840 [Spirochaetia bacterium]
MRKDLFIVTYSSLKTYGGGIESWLIKFLSCSEKLFHIYNKIYVLGYKSDNNYLISDIIKDQNIHFVFLDIAAKLNIFCLFKYFIRARAAILKAIKENDRAVDLLSIGTLYPSIPMYLIAKINVRRVIWLRSLYFKQINILQSKKIKSVLLFIEYICLKKADIVIANGYDTRDAYQNRYNMKNIIVIPNAIDISVVKENLKPFQGEKIKIGYIGRFSPDKGIDYFIESIDIYNKKSKTNNKEFIFIGWGEEEYKILSLIEAYSNVKYIGKLNNSAIFEELSRLDATVNLSTSGTIGGGGVSNSLLESIFANNLIICWDNPIFKQIINNDFGYLLPEGDINALLAIYDELNNKQKAIKKIENSKKLKANYLFSKHIETFISLME